MEINNEKLEEIYTTMQEINNNNKKNFDDLKSMTASISQNWTGEASEYFIKKYTSVTNMFDEFYDTLNKRIAYLMTRANQVEMMEAANMAIASSLGSRKK